MPTFLAISNQKGGVGKTTTAVHLSVAFAAASRRVLLVDLDAQGNATNALGLEGAENNYPRSYEAATGDTPITEHSCLPTVFPNLFVLPSSIELAGVKLEIDADEPNLLRLGANIGQLADGFDWIVFDCPPSLGILSVNALVVADFILAPLPPERFAMDGFERLEETVRRLRNAERSHAADPLILFTRVPPWSTKSRERINEFRAHRNTRTLVAEIPFSDLFEIGAETKRTIFLDFCNSPPAIAYLYAASKLLSTVSNDSSIRTIEAQVFEMERTIQEWLDNQISRADRSKKSKIRFDRSEYRKQFTVRQMLQRLLHTIWR
ncbi:MAG: ParA family protein [Minwuia sp.]|uniref:ParA family protein n=1 Tax=Minwuia sp. TaxID=2493630 RepID=UPI003A8BFB50